MIAVKNQRERYRKGLEENIFPMTNPCLPQKVDPIF
jgi:hypothetical protein